MADEIENREDRWWLLTRRDLGLPDVMTDESGRAAVIGRLASEFEGGNLASAGQAYDFAEKLLDCVLEYGAEGSLDDCFVGDSAMRQGLEDANLVSGADPGARITTLVGGGGTAETQDRAARAVGWLVGQVGGYARQHLDDT